MSLPRWFELTLLEAEDAAKEANFTKLGAQFALRVEEVVPRKSMDAWWALAKEWNDPSKLDEGELGETERRVLEFLEGACPECMARIPEDERADFLRGLYAKKG